MFGRGPDGKTARWGAARGSRPGRGGISRGRGDAALQYRGETKGRTDAFKARKLPPGARPSREWQRLGVRRAAPDAHAQRDTSAGSAGDEGPGEASWRRRLAPRHRQVVRRYFDTGK